MNPLIEWLVDDWGQAWARSPVNPRRFNSGQRRALRWQMRLGRGVKGLVVALPFLLLFTLAAEPPLARPLVALWTLGAGALLAAHVALALRHGVSFGWALHHRSPCILTAGGARGDCLGKALLALGSLGCALLALLLR